MKAQNINKISSSVSISESFLSPAGFWCCLGTLTEKSRSNRRFLFGAEKYNTYWSEIVLFIGNNSNKNSDNKVIYTSRLGNINQLISWSPNAKMTQKLHGLNNTIKRSNHKVYVAEETNDALGVWLSDNKIQLSNFRAKIFIEDGYWVFSVSAKSIKSSFPTLFTMSNEIRSILK